MKRAAAVVGGGLALCIGVAGLGLVVQRDGPFRLVRPRGGELMLARCSPGSVAGVRRGCWVGVDAVAAIDLEVDAGLVRTGFWSDGTKPDDCVLVTPAGRREVGSCECCALLEAAPSRCSGAVTHLCNQAPR